MAQVTLAEEGKFRVKPALKIPITELPSAIHLMQKLLAGNFLSGKGVAALELLKQGQKMLPDSRFVEAVVPKQVFQTLKGSEMKLKKKEAKFLENLLDCVIVGDQDLQVDTEMAANLSERLAAFCQAPKPPRKPKPPKLTEDQWEQVACGLQGFLDSRRQDFRDRPIHDVCREIGAYLKKLAEARAGTEIATDPLPVKQEAKLPKPPKLSDDMLAQMANAARGYLNASPQRESDRGLNSTLLEIEDYFKKLRRSSAGTEIAFRNLAPFPPKS